MTRKSCLQRHLSIMGGTHGWVDSDAPVAWAVRRKSEGLERTYIRH